LRPDSVTLSDDAETGLVRVTNTVGGGFFAVRCTPPSPVDLRDTPVLELPLCLGDDAVINLHLAIGDRSYLLRLGDTPVTATKALLTPAFETGECFRLPDLPTARWERGVGLGTAMPTDGLLRVDLLARLQAAGGATTVPMLTLIALGNTSNAGYLLAGHGGNQAGAWYAVGVPQFRNRSPRTE
jgi:hypothetical protein